jgi:hypothetical protein
MNTQDTTRETVRETDTRIVIDGVEVLVSTNSDYMPDFPWPGPWGGITNSDPA